MKTKLIIDKTRKHVNKEYWLRFPIAIFILLLPCMVIQSAFSQTLGLPISVNVNANPRTIVVADVNLDGLPDALTANQNSNTVSITLGDGFGNFTPTTEIPVDVGPIGLAIADFNLDGKPDFVSSNFFANNLSIRFGDGLGGFSGTTNYNTALTPEKVITTDINNDGNSDVVYFAAGQAFFHLGDGTGNLGIQQIIVSGVSGFSDIFVEDINLDGNQDFLASRTGNNEVEILLGDGTGGFSPSANLNFGSGPCQIFVADINLDSKPDLISTHCGIAMFIVSLGNGAGGFSITNSYSEPGNPGFLSVEDMNLDGKPDIIMSFINNSELKILLGDGLGGFSNGLSISPGIRHIITPDINLDGKPDILGTNGSFNSFSSILNTTTATPTITYFTPTSGPIGTSVTITGTNFDATPANNVVYFGATRANLTAATATQLTVTVPTGATYQPITVQVSGLTGFSGKPFVVTFAGGGVIDACSFKPRVNFTTGTTPLAIYMSDLDGDGKADMVTANQNANTISVFRNTGTSGIIDGGSFAVKVDFSVGVQPYFIVVGDVDGDGKPDLIIPNESSGTVSVLRNTSVVGTLDATSFAAKVDFMTGAAPHSVSLHDLDEDGKPEMVVANHNSNMLSVLKNTSAPGIINASSFAPKVDFGTGTNPQSVGIADLDGDGKPDLVVTNGNAGTNTLSVLRNTTSSGTINGSSFASKVDFTTGLYPRSLAIGDIDGDSKPDLATANFSGNSISILRNTSTAGSITAGSFAATVNFTAGSGPHAISISDLDGDGRNDIVVASAGSASIGVFKNQSTPGAFTAASLAVKVDFIAGFGPVNLALGDVDGDGKNDMTVSNGGANTFSVFRNLIGEISLPTVSSFTPSFGSAGTSVTINGTNFSTPFTNTVEFNGMSATITASTATTITVDVPAGATTGIIEVTIGCNTINSSTNFVVCSPPSAPVAIHNSGCSGASILLGASGGSPGLYLWYSVSTGGTALPGEVNDSFTTPTLTNNASYWVTITDGPCESTRTEVIAQIDAPPTAPTATGASDFPPAVLTLTASGGTNGQYRWYTTATGGTALVGEVNSTYTTPSLSISTTYYVSIDNGQCESVRTPVVAGIKVNSPPVIQATNARVPVEGKITVSLSDLISDPENNLDFSTLTIVTQPISGARATIEPVNNLVLDYSGISFSGTDQLTIGICDQLAACSQQDLTIEVFGDITVYNALSPNGDDKNPIFFLQNIDILADTKENTVSIYNRWGDVVFETENYDNVNRVFRGLNKSGDELPAGTYFYRIEFVSGTKTKTGFLALRK